MTDLFSRLELSDPEFEQEGMRLATVKSPALRARGDVSVWVPPAISIDTLLILLHGVYGSHWVWAQKAGVHRIAQRMIHAGQIPPLVIAMPSDGLMGDGSGYFSYPDGADVERWIVDEVPAIAKIAAPAVQNGAKIAIAGLSMGGYGALRLGAKYPERFECISAHSAMTAVTQMPAFVEEPLSGYLQCGTPEDLSALYWLRKHRARLPRLRFDCGAGDALIAPNRDLHHALEQDGIPHSFQEFAGGHDWRYWRQHVVQTLLFAVERQNRPEAA